MTARLRKAVRNVTIHPRRFSVSEAFFLHVDGLTCADLRGLGRDPDPPGICKDKKIQYNDL